MRASEVGVKPLKEVKPPVGVSELGLPSLTTKDELKRQNVRALYQAAVDFIHKNFKTNSDFTHSPEKEEAFEKLHAWERQVDKYRSYLEKVEKNNDRQIRAAAKEAKVRESNRVAGVAQGIVKSLALQEGAMAQMLVDGYHASIDKAREVIAKHNGSNETMTKSEEEYLSRHPYVFDKSNSGYGLPERFVDKNGKVQYKRNYVIDEEKADPIKLLEAARNIAHENIVNFANKLVVKTEGIAGKDEKLVGQPIVHHSSLDPWGNSTIEINTTNRKVVWKTNMIFNRSKLNNMFNQWPTRMVSNEERKG